MVTIGAWTGSIQTIPANGTAFVFAGPTTTLKTNATQTITAAGSAALAISQPLEKGDLEPSEAFNLGICRQSSGGGDVTLLDGNVGDYEVVTATPTRIPYAISMTAPPGAGSWRVGMCVENPNATDLDNNDFAIGTASVSNATFIPPPVDATEAQAAAKSR